MTRKEIEELNVLEPYCFETDEEEQWYQVGCIEGLRAADCSPKVSALYNLAAEIPKHGGDIIITSYFGSFDIASIPSDLEGGKLSSESWKKFVNENDINLWAYLRDLLPRKNIY